LGQIAQAGASGRVRRIHINLSSHGSTARKLLVAGLARMLGVKYLIHVHGSRFDVFVDGLPPMGRAMVRAMLEQAETVIVLGEYWRDFVVGKLGVSAHKVRVIFNCVPLPERLAEGSPDGIPHILFLGRLGERKGVPELLEALAAMKELPWRATLAGDGEVERFRTQAEALGLGDRVAFPGWVDRGAVQALLHSADVVTLPSYKEGLPMSVIEGLANRIAVVATPAGATGEIITHDHSGLLVPPGDAAALAAALSRVVSDPHLRRRLAQAGHDVFLEVMEASAIAQRISLLYQELDAGC
ncbi:MAG: glycosyltransferase family 4 protein, partial [Magnetospirillum sp.]|nr:glycosyltransferase family 4 protein [Magnetospirillum sp.]